MNSMHKALRLITNNPMVVERWEKHRKIHVVFVEGNDCREVLVQVRDQIHHGCRLLTHPYSGSLKPNENPYRSVLITAEPELMDLNHVAMIEQCIQTTNQAIARKKIPVYRQQVLVDFMMLDGEMIASGLQSALDQ